MERDEDSVPQFTSRRPRRWIGRKRSPSDTGWIDALGGSFDLGELVVHIVRVLGRVVAAFFEHHHW